MRSMSPGRRQYFLIQIKKKKNSIAYTVTLQVSLFILGNGNDS